MGLIAIYVPESRLHGFQEIGNLLDSCQRGLNLSYPVK
jgi:hypothetical protein